MRSAAPGTVRWSRYATALGLTLLVGSLVLGRQVLQIRESRRCARTMAAMREVGLRLVAYHVAHGRFPKNEGTLVLDCTALNPTEEPLLPVHDGWGQPLVLLTTPDGSRSLVLSAGSDGACEPQVGGPFLASQHWRDLIFLDGDRWYQYPESYQCGCQCPGTTREWVARDRAEATAARDDNEAIWKLHAAFVAASKR